MVETAQPAAPENQAPVATTSGVDKKAEQERLKKMHTEFLSKLKANKQEVVMKFKRSNDAVLCVFTPDSYSGQGCISCAADHAVKSKLLHIYGYEF